MRERKNRKKRRRYYERNLHKWNINNRSREESISINEEEQADQWRVVKTLWPASETWDRLSLNSKLIWTNQDKFDWHFQTKRQTPIYKFSRFLFSASFHLHIRWVDAFCFERLHDSSQSQWQALIQHCNLSVIAAFARFIFISNKRLKTLLWCATITKSASRCAQAINKCFVKRQLWWIENSEALLFSRFRERLKGQVDDWKMMLKLLLNFLGDKLK